MKEMISENLKQVHQNIQSACLRGGRSPADITLIAVSKTKPLEELFEAYGCGERNFGENKVQEILQKAPQMPEDTCFHMIGHLQRNKVRQVLPHVKMIHSVDSVRLAREIEQEAERLGKLWISFWRSMWQERRANLVFLWRIQWMGFCRFPAFHIFVSAA